MNEIVDVAGAVRTFQRGAEEVRALDGVDLAVEQGDFLAVVGPSGSGKTTLLNLIGCVDRPTSGTVTVHGMQTEDLTDRALATIRSTTMGFVFQHFLLMPTLTAKENVMVPGRFYAKRDRDRDLEARAKKLLDTVGLAARADHLPRELSGGEMQRVALARALINEPEILLADEPTGNLDTVSADEIARIFRELNDAGLTIVVVTHNLELAASATRGIKLRDGKITEQEELRPVPARPAAPLQVERASEPEAAAAPEVEAQPEPEAPAVPEYMPQTITRRKWGSPAVSGGLGLLGVVMCATAFMPFLSERSGFGLMSDGFFTVTLRKGNELTRVFFGSPASVFTGIWPFVLGLLLIAAGALYLFRRRRTSGWISILTGALGAVLAVTNLLMVYARLGADASRGYAGMSPGYGLWVMLGVSIASLAAGVVILAARGPRPAGADEQA